MMPLRKRIAGLLPNPKRRGQQAALGAQSGGLLDFIGDIIKKPFKTLLSFGKNLIISGGNPWAAAALTLAEFAFGADASNRAPDISGGGQTVNAFSSDKPRTWIYGKATVGGVIAYQRSRERGIKGDPVNETMGRLLLVADHEVEGWEDFFLYGERLDMSADGYAKNELFSYNHKHGKFARLWIYGGYSNGKNYQGLSAWRHLAGTVPLAIDGTQSIPALPDPNWDASRKLTGISFLTVIAYYDYDVFHQGFPSVQAVVKGKRIWDPRPMTLTATYSVVSSNPSVGPEIRISADKVEIGSPRRSDFTDAESWHAERERILRGFQAGNSIILESGSATWTATFSAANGLEATFSASEGTPPGLGQLSSVGFADSGFAWSDNPALVLLDFLLYHPALQLQGDRNWIDLPSFEAAADACEEMVPLAIASLEDRTTDRDYRGLNRYGASDLSGIVGTDDTLYVLDFPTATMLAFDRSTKQQDAAKTITLDSLNNTPVGMTAHGGTVWVGDLNANKLFAYSLATRARQSAKDFSASLLTSAGISTVGGIFTNGTYMWVVDAPGKKAAGFNLSARTRNAAQDIALTGSSRPASLWSDGTTMWVADSALDMLRAYSLSTKARTPSKDVHHLIERSPTGLWGEGNWLYVVSANGDSIIAYNKTDLAAVGPAYTFGGVVQLTQTPQDVISAIAKSMAGRLWFSEGQFHVLAGKYYAPQIELTDEDILGQVNVGTSIQRRDRFCTVRGRYRPFPSQLNTEYPEVRSTDAGCPEDDYMPMDLFNTSQPGMAQRLAKIALHRNRQRISMTGEFGLRAMRSEVGDILRITNSELGFVRKEFQVQEWRFGISNAASLSVSLVLRETNAAIYDWTLADETVFEDDNLVPGKTDPVPILPPPPSGEPGTPTIVPVNPGNRVPPKDIELFRNTSPKGMAIHGDVLLAMDDHADGARICSYATSRSGADIGVYPIPVQSPWGIASLDGARYYVGDTGNSILVLDAHFRIAEGAISGSLAGVSNMRGIAVDTDYLYAVSSGNNRILRFNRSTGAAASGSGFPIALDSANSHPEGLAITETHLFVCDTTDAKAYAYSLSNGTYDSSADVAFSSANADPTGMAATEHLLYVADATDLEAYAYALQAQDVEDWLTEIPLARIPVLPTAKLADGSVTNPKLATDAVTQSKVADDAIGADELDTHNSAATGLVLGFDTTNGLQWVEQSGGIYNPPPSIAKTFSGTTTNFAETGIWEAMSQDNTAASRTLLLRQPGTAGLSRGEKFILVVGTTGNVDIGINSADSAAMQIVVFDDQGKRTVVHGTNQRLITPEGGWENSPQNRIYTAEVLTPLRWGLRLGVWWNSASSLAETHPEDAVTFSTTKVIAASDLGKWVAAAQTRGVTRTITLNGNIGSVGDRFVLVVSVSPGGSGSRQYAYLKCTTGSIVLWNDAGMTTSMPGSQEKLLDTYGGHESGPLVEAFTCIKTAATEWTVRQGIGWSGLYGGSAQPPTAATALAAAHTVVAADLGKWLHATLSNVAKTITLNGNLGTVGDKVFLSLAIHPTGGGNRQVTIGIKRANGTLVIFDDEGRTEITGTTAHNLLDTLYYQGSGPQYGIFTCVKTAADTWTVRRGVW